MRSRLVMVSCKGPHTTPWMFTQGGESRIRVLHMVEGERIVVDLEDQHNHAVFDSVGEFPFRPASRFRLHKHREIPEGSPTIVEVLYDG